MIRNSLLYISGVEIFEAMHERVSTYVWRTPCVILLHATIRNFPISILSYRKLDVSTVSAKPAWHQVNYIISYSVVLEFVRNLFLAAHCTHFSTEPNAILIKLLVCNFMYFFPFYKLWKSTFCFSFQQCSRYIKRSTSMLKLI